MLQYIKLKYFLFHLILFLGIYLVPIAFAPIPVIVVCLIVFFLKRDHVSVLLLGAYSIMCKSEAVYFAYIIVLGILMLLDTQKKTKKNSDILKITKKVYLLLAYLAVVYIIQLFLGGSFLSLPFFAITGLSFFLIMFYVWNANLKLDSIYKILGHIYLLGCVQVVIAFVFQVMPYGIQHFLDSPMAGDSVYGTTGHSNFMGNIVIFSSIAVILQLFSIKKGNLLTRTNLFAVSTLFVAIAMLIINDAKAVLYTAFLGVCVLFFVKIVRKTSVISRILVIFSSIVILLIMFGSIVNKLVDVGDEYDEYFYGKANSKFVYYQHTFDPSTRNLLQFMIGTGGGTNGSRAANALAYDKFPKVEGAAMKLPSFIPPKTNAFTEKYVLPLYDLRYREEIGNISALLGSPFNTFCALIVEFGIIGFFMFLGIFLYIFRRIIYNKDCISMSLMVMLIYLVVMSVVYQTIETPSIMFFVSLYVGIIFSNNMREKLSYEKQ